MNSLKWRRIMRPVTGVAALAAVPLFLTDCGGGMPGAGSLPGGCPADIADASAIMSANFGLEGELEGKVKAALAAGANLQKIAVEVEGEVTTACSNLAKDLGKSDADLAPKEDGPGKKAEAACAAAAAAIGEFKGKAKGSLTVDVQPPECKASMSAMADCSAECNADIKPGEAKVTCEGGEISGKCGGECKGSCTVEAGAECSGSCSGECKGECSGSFSGKCEGDCEGTCEGKDSKGKCAGRCEGTCKGSGSGTCSADCKGTCSASCKVSGQADCKGECSGECSVEMEAPKCSGEVKPPEMSAECKANCDAKLNAELECTPARVMVKLSGAADAEAGVKLAAALEKNLPALLKVSIGMKGKLEGVVGSVQASLEGVQAAVTGGGEAAMKVGGCFAASLEAQAKASASINVSVQASASASGEASAG